MKRKDLIVLNTTLLEVGQLKSKDPYFAYKLALNINALKTEIEAIQKAEEFKIDLEKRRIELAEKLADKNQDGQPIIENNAYKLSNDNKIKYTEGLLEIRKELDIGDKEKKLNDLLDEEVNITFIKIKTSLLPEGITGNQISVMLNHIIEE